MPNTIQPQENSRGGGTGGPLYITASGGYPDLLGVNRNDDGRWLNTYNGQPDNGWNREIGFVFLVPATHFVFFPSFGRGSFVLLAVHSNRPAFCRSRRV